MKRLFLTILFTMLISTVFAQQVGQMMRGRSPSGANPFISVDETGRINTTSSIGTVPVSITTQFVATDSLNQYKVNIASVSVSSVPAKITNWNEMPFVPAPPYATNTSQMLRVSIATAEVLLASPIALDDASRTVVNIGSYSTVIPASITNFPETTQLVTNDDNELLVAISSQSAVLVASISNLPATQQLKVDTDSNLTVNLASFTASMSVGVTNILNDTPGNILVNIASITASGSTLYTDSAGNLYVNLASSVAVVAVQIDPTVGYLTVGAASRTITLPSAGTPVNLGAYIPAAAKIVKFTAFNGACIINSADDLATGTMYCGDYVASGSYLKYDGLAAGTRAFYGASNDSGATVTLKMVCY